jgi:RNA 3'-terminal phosphate cyclase (ATP)
MLTIDGAQGEGGGQILRSSLALSLVTQTPVRIDRIRARRRRPGLMRQHLTAVRAAQAISGARVEGAELGSESITFTPGAVTPGEYELSVGTAGSTGLVFQTVLPALATASAPSTIRLRGGTHNPSAPPFDFLERALLPVVARMGPVVRASLERPGFYPAGGGRVVYSIEPCKKLMPIELVDPGEIQRVDVTATVAGLASQIAERELAVVLGELELSADRGRIRELPPAYGPGNTLNVDVVSAALTEVFTGFGEKGIRAEDVAVQVARQVRAYLRSGAPVGPHLADQLLMWLALAGGGRFRTTAPTAHTTTHAEVIHAFLDVRVLVEHIEDELWEVVVRPESLSRVSPRPPRVADLSRPKGAS